MKRALFAAVHAALGTVLLTGCGGTNDLQVTNRYNAPIELRQDGKPFGTVAPGETKTFPDKGGEQGSATETVEVVRQGKSLGKIGQIGHDMRRESTGGLNGSGALVVVLGPN